MTQLSRPFQIALVAVVMFALVWFVALHGHSTKTQLDAGGKRACRRYARKLPRLPPPRRRKRRPPRGRRISRGMTRAVTHAHEAVAASQQAADRSAGASAEAPSKGTAGTSSSTTVIRSKQAGAGAHGSKTVTASRSTTVTSAKHGAGIKTSTTVTVTKSATPANKAGAGASSAIPPPAGGRGSELKRGEVVVRGAVLESAGRGR